MTKPNPLCCEPPAQRRSKVMDSDHQLATLAKALGHPARVRILRRLSARKTCICGDLVLQVGLAQSTVSQHLKVLKSAGLIQGSISGPSTCYCLQPEAFRLLSGLLADFNGEKNGGKKWKKK